MLGKYSPLAIFLTGLPLYAGPFLAGWMDETALVLLALAVLCFVGQMGGGKAKGRGQMQLVPFMVMLACAQLVAVAVVCGAGVLLGLVTGLVGVPLWVPLACTAVGAMIFARQYRQNPQDAESIAAIGDAIEQITQMTPCKVVYDHSDKPDDPHAR